MPDEILNITEETQDPQVAENIINDAIESDGKPVITSEDRNKPENITVGDGEDMGFLDEAVKDFQEKKNAPTEEEVEVAKEEKEAAGDKEVKTKEKEETEEVPEHELTVLPTDKPSTKKRINAFLANEKKLKAEAEALRKELEEAKKQPKTQANLEEVERIKQEKLAAEQELIKYRRRYDIDNDPEFKSKFDEPIKQSEQAIEETLKKYNLGESTLKAIRDSGGFAAFSRSEKIFKIPQVVDGVQQHVAMTAAELAKHWVDNLAIPDAELIRQAVGRQEVLSLERKATIERELQNANEYFSKKHEEEKRTREQVAESQRQMAERYNQLVAEAENSLDWIKDKEIPVGATPEQKKEIEEYNLTQRELRESFRKNITNTEEYFELKRDAAFSRHLQREEARLKKELEAARAEIDKLKDSMKVTSKGGSLMTQQKKEPRQPKNPVDDDFLGGMDSKIASLIKGKNVTF